MIKRVFMLMYIFVLYRYLNNMLAQITRHYEEQGKNYDSEFIWDFKVILEISFTRARVTKT